VKLFKTGTLLNFLLRIFLYAVLNEGDNLDRLRVISLNLVEPRLHLSFSASDIHFHVPKSGMMGL
jgi:hypothetical protein